MNHVKLIILFSLSMPLFLNAINEKSKSVFGKQVSESGIRHSFLICGKPTALVNEQSQIVWQTKGYGRDGFVLENGNILVSIGGENMAKEITRAGEVVWS